MFRVKVLCLAGNKNGRIYIYIYLLVRGKKVVHARAKSDIDLQFTWLVQNSKNLLLFIHLSTLGVCE